ncbi:MULTISPECIES: magnesium-translocating P-type ATPase [Aerococcus]|uniref:Magnesium-transporting ATPase, P-type 1 n=1 Tax=Aerococcus urinae TaxID=1376 RepID=A0A329P512_9LACT|nr:MULTISPECIES: magnesium-translocating P-type ATPase [Aerococcus]MDK6728160.1 magnesium-translocating P-type ATPase [Aerococcus urinae]RAV80788.1 magnesium-translocating P-type ATPase [Aerococcus loyolae]
MKKFENQSRYRQFAAYSISELFNYYNIDQNGLSDDQVQALREEYGENVIDYGDKASLMEELVQAYLTPFTLILIGLAIISFFTDYVFAAADSRDCISSVIILVLVFISGTVSFIQSKQSNDAAEHLKEMVKVTANVKRAGDFNEIPTEEIVCGDLVKLSAGDLIPADLRIIESKDLFVSQAAMTGESYPVEKMAQATDHAETVFDETNLAFMGSNVISGSAVGLVIAVGEDTLFGDIAKTVTTEEEVTNFDIGISKISTLLMRFMGVMVPVVFLINGIHMKNWLDALIFAISVAVGLTPEMLPMIVTTNLVKGSQTMAKGGTIVKNLNAIQSFGAMDVLCTDKTGTLTQDKIVLEMHLNCDGDEDSGVLRHAYLNSYYQTGLKNLMDVAIIEATHRELDLDPSYYHKVDEIPFDFERRRMSVVVEDKAGKRQLITKGAVEEMLAISSLVLKQGQAIPLTDDLRQEIRQQVKDLNEDGLRVIGIAQKTNPPAVDAFSIEDESDMLLIGYLAFLDPPKESTQPALKALADHQVDVKVLTGDNEEVTRSVCRQVGISADSIINGIDLEAMDEEALAQAVEDYQVFVKISPQQKAQITQILQDNGHVVGFMGDGINDAAALTTSDVGISVDTAVDIAKESADIILLEKDLMILEKGVVSGREIFGNIMKYINITTSSNFGNTFSILMASLFLPFLPMMPTQLLVLNLIYDIACISIPWDRMDASYLKEPKNWDASHVKNFMIYFGPISSIFDVLSFVALYHWIIPQVLNGTYWSLSTGQQAIFEALFHSGWFVVSLWSQTLVLHMLRTEKLPFIQSRPSFIFTTITTIGIIFGSLLPRTKLGFYLGLAPLPGSFWLLLVAIVISYLVLVTLVKHFYVKHYGKLL